MILSTSPTSASLGIASFSNSQRRVRFSASSREAFVWSSAAWKTGDQCALMASRAAPHDLILAPTDAAFNPTSREAKRKPLHLPHLRHADGAGPGPLRTCILAHAVRIAFAARPLCAPRNDAEHRNRKLLFEQRQIRKTAPVGALGHILIVAVPMALQQAQSVIIQPRHRTRQREHAQLAAGLGMRSFRPCELLLVADDPRCFTSIRQRRTKSSKITSSPSSAAAHNRPRERGTSAPSANNLGTDRLSTGNDCRCVQSTNTGEWSLGLSASIHSG